MNYGYEKNNKWLIDEEYLLKECNYENKEFLKQIANRIFQLKKFCPVPFVSTYDPVHKSIYITIGGNKEKFPLNDLIHPNDFVNQIKYWLESFYISFSVIKNKFVPLQEEIIARRVKAGEDLDTLLLERVKKQIVADYRLVKTTIKDDEFLMQVGGTRSRVREVRISNFPLSDFLTQWRKLYEEVKEKDSLTKGRVLYTFMRDNSRIVKVIKNLKGLNFVEYFTKEQVDFFFKINEHKIKGYPLNTQTGEEGEMFNINYFNIFIKDLELKAYFQKEFLQFLK